MSMTNITKMAWKKRKKTSKISGAKEFYNNNRTNKLKE